MIEFAGGTDGKVAVIDYDTGDVRELGVFEWGAQTPGCAHLALSILRVLLDDTRAVKYHRRFMHRVITPLAKGIDWSATDEQVMAVVRQIEEAATDMAPERQRMAREFPKGGVNIAMGTSRWGSERSGFQSSAPTIEPNDPKKSKARPSIHDGAPLKQ